MTSAKLFAERLRRGVPCEIKRSTVSETVAVRGYASTFGGIDAYGDTIEPGAYAVSLAKHRKDGTRPVMLWQHDPSEPIGVWDRLEEDGKGLFVEGRLLTSVRRGAEAAALIEVGGVAGLSIGYRIERQKQVGSVRHLIEIDLIEVSVVSFPADHDARIDPSKQHDGKRFLLELLSGGRDDKARVFLQALLR
ncbi:HK97 family phage prohead protease [Bradyrhizobium sp. 18]|uniref:HK97 family phage prohead protease n=1 Tax=Bradyrhizobium sp. 18 TaxID=2782657 RepID=UPI001FFB5C5A|nr:HK97 family phage prohead protease [Bradyrhizobium sp. 18]MCK1507186.1 HK97 family phage prohead protease [Bradyrhizobium sp. 18]